MRLCNGRGDVEPESKALNGRLGVPPVERLEQPIHHYRRNGSASIGDRDFELAGIGPCRHAYRLILRPVGNCVGEEVGEQLGQAAMIGLDVPIHVDLNLNGPLGIARLYLRNDLRERRSQGAIRRVKRDPATQPAAGEIEDIVDQTAHSEDAAAHEADDLVRLVRLWLPHQDIDAAVDRREGVAQIVAQDGDELLAQLSRLVLFEQSTFGELLASLGGLLGDHQFTLITATLGGLKLGETREHERTRRISTFGGVGENLDRSAVRLNEVQRDLVEVALHPKKGREVGFVEHLPGDVQQLPQALPLELGGLVANPV